MPPVLPTLGRVLGLLEWLAAAARRLRRIKPPPAEAPDEESHPLSHADVDHIERLEDAAISHKVRPLPPPRKKPHGQTPRKK